jgi:hypothetical protein
MCPDEFALSVQMASGKANITGSTEEKQTNDNPGALALFA